MGILYPHVRKHLSFVSGLCPLPASTLSVSRLSAGQAALPSRVGSPMGLCLRTPGFRDSPGLDTRQLSGSNGQVTTCPRKQLCASTPSKVRITARSWGQVSLHSGVFVSMPANEAALLGLWGLFPWGGQRPYGLYQILSTQGNCFSPCGTWTPWKGRKRIFFIGRLESN